MRRTARLSPGATGGASDRPRMSAASCKSVRRRRAGSRVPDSGDVCADLCVLVAERLREMPLSRGRVVAQQLEPGCLISGKFVNVLPEVVGLWTSTTGPFWTLLIVMCWTGMRLSFSGSVKISVYFHRFFGGEPDCYGASLAATFALTLGQERLAGNFPRPMTSRAPAISERFPALFACDRHRRSDLRWADHAPRQTVAECYGIWRDPPPFNMVGTVARWIWARPLHVARNVHPPPLIVRRRRGRPARSAGRVDTDGDRLA